jgi:hypothetical protein
VVVVTDQDIVLIMLVVLVVQGVVVQEHLGVVREYQVQETLVVTPQLKVMLAVRPGTLLVQEEAVGLLK